MRGLKRYSLKKLTYYFVASFTDAWIETCKYGVQEIRYCVASFTDAWIETVEMGRKLEVTQSHLLQMRGLKPQH